METSQLTSFYIRATLALNGLNLTQKLKNFDTVRIRTDEEKLRTKKD